MAEQIPKDEPSHGNEDAHAKRRPVDSRQRRIIIAFMFFIGITGRIIHSIVTSPPSCEWIGELHVERLKLSMIR